MIECRDVTARAGHFSLRDVSFTVPAGGHAVLTGPTASGKTTLLDVIAGFTRPMRGSVSIDGRDATDAPPEARAVGFVPQHGYLFPHLDVRDNVAYGAGDAAIVAMLMERFGIASLAPRTVGSLSGGERQLVALCRALAPRPRIVLLDEPFSALDEARRTSVAAEFAAVQREEGFTVLHATHYPGEAGARASMWPSMSDGVVCAGAPSAP